MSEGEFQFNKNMSKNLPYAGTIVDRPKYNPNYNYSWKEATVRERGMTARPAGQQLTVAICPEDPRFCIINNRKKSTIRTDALDFNENSGETNE